MSMFTKSWAMALCMILAIPAMGQRVVPIAASSDPATPTDIFPVIMGDTTAAGTRVDNNTVYTLENGQVYVTSGRLVNTSDWPLQIEAVDPADTDNKAILTRQPNTSGNYPDIGRPEGDVTFRNLWIISGERGALENHDWGKFRLSGANSRVVVQDCIIEKERGGFLQVRADGIKIFMDGCVLRNGGNRRVFQGNGRGVDARDFYLDTLVITNTIVHNIQDRFFRSQGGAVPHNYVKIDHCTAFNVVGRHGFIQLGRVNEAIITNNMFVNPIMLGSTAGLVDEQTQPDADLHKVITVDTLYAETDLTIESNNIFWTSDVTSYWNSVDSINAPGVLSQLVKDHLGADTATAYFSEVLDLNSVPGSILQYVQDLHANPAATDMFDFIVEDIAVQGTAFDSGNLFDFSTFSVCYSETSQSATASTTGGAIGAVASCDFAPNSIFNRLTADYSLKISPNPVGQTAVFEFSIPNADEVSLEIYDLSGRKVAVLREGMIPAGTSQISWTVPSELTEGLYLARLRATEGVQTLKFLLN